MSVYIIHHSDTDGYGAKYAAWKKFGDSAKYYPVNYGHAFPVKNLKKDDQVFLLDFNFSKEIVDNVAKQCHLEVLDHHKTAIEECGHEDYFKGSMDHAGCVLAWKRFHDAPVPKLLQHIEDWDLWRFWLEGTKPLHAMTEVYKESMEFWDRYCDVPDNMISAAGKMYDMHCHYVNIFCQKAWMTEHFGHKCIIMNGAYPFISDCAHHLLETYPEAEIAIVYSQEETTLRVSLRSRKDGPDVAEIARQRGGGGHKNAAGYSNTDCRCSFDEMEKL